MASPSVFTREKLIEIGGTLPPTPRIFSDLHALLKDTNTDLDLITELIKRDASLSAQILRVSNSVAFRSELRSGSIEEAVGRVGFDEVFRIVGVVAVQSLADRALVHYDVSAERLRELMVETAFVCEALAPECGLDPRTAYTAGLMRPIGILVLDRVAQLLRVPEFYDYETDRSYVSWEGRHFGLDSCEVAGLILSEWSFPGDIISAIRNQHLTHESAVADRLACLVNLASGAVALRGKVLEGERIHWEITAAKLSCLGLDEARFTEVSDRALEAYEVYHTASPKEAKPLPRTATKALVEETVPVRPKGSSRAPFVAPEPAPRPKPRRKRHGWTLPDVLGVALTMLIGHFRECGRTGDFETAYQVI